MKNVFCSKIPGLFILMLLAVACKKTVNPCVKSLFERDERLIRQTDSIIVYRSAMPLRAYREALQQLRGEEEQIFSEVKNCEFGDDLRSYNYWHRGRLKFPGRIEQELQRIERDSAGR